MKKTVIASVIALSLLGAPAFAETVASTPTPKDTTDTKPVEVVLTKKQKIEADLRDATAKLKLVITRTQVLIDLLTKNGKDVSDAQTALTTAQTALDDATTAIDQFAGVVAPVAKTLDTKGEDRTPKPKEVAPLKDPLKKAQESLKTSKASLIESITDLKDGLAPKDSSN